MQKILITGVSGVGKSTVCKKLADLGFDARDIEVVEGMFQMFHKGTRRVFEDYDNSKPENIKDGDWICDVGKLKTLLEFQKSEIAFYSGISSNMDDILPLFDKVIVLQPDSRTLNERLKSREGTDNIGNTQAGRDVVLGWKDEWEDEMRKKGAIFVDANKAPEEIAKEILSELRISPSPPEKER